VNKKQREAKRKNAQQHQKKAQQLNKERLARINSPEHQERLAKSRAVMKQLPVSRAVIASSEPVSGVLDDPLIDTFRELQRTLASDGDIGATIASVIRARTQHDDVLEGEFHVVEDPVKQLP